MLDLDTEVDEKFGNVNYRVQMKLLLCSLAAGFRNS